MQMPQQDGQRANNNDDLPKEVNDGLLGTWLRLTAPAGARNYENAPSRSQRERLRRAGLTSYMAPVVFFAPLLLLQQASNLATLVSIVTMMVIACIAVIFNRLGKQTIAALLLVLSMDIVIEGSLLTASGGLSTGWLLTFDLFVVPLIAVGVLLSRRYVWIFMVVHITCILGDFFLMPHAPDLQLLIQYWHGPAVAFARPIIIQLGVALLCFIEVRSTDQAIARADKAEELSMLREQVAKEKRALEIGIQEIVKTLTNAANGHYASNSILSKDNVLWRISSTLNTLFHRLQSARKQELTVHQAEQDISRLLEAIRASKRGQYPGWPHPSGGILDPLIRELREASPSSPPSTQQFSPSPPLPTEKPGSRTNHGLTPWPQEPWSQEKTPM
jgi:hypothetical protein